MLQLAGVQLDHISTWNAALMVLGTLALGALLLFAPLLLRGEDERRGRTARCRSCDRRGRGSMATTGNGRSIRSR